MAPITFVAGTATSATLAGSMVHKATHHFDLVNWWLDTQPETVFAFGDLRFYGRENAEERGVTEFYERVHGRNAAKDDLFALHMEQSETLRRMYLEAEHEDGYLRDQSVFGEGISIEDDMAVLVRYRNRATMSYHLTTYSPWEGYRIAFNGTKGLLNTRCKNTPISAGTARMPICPRFAAPASARSTNLASIVIHPLWGEPVREDVTTKGGDHGGGDARLLRAIFVGLDDDPLGHAADHVADAMSILTGIAANRSFATGLPVEVASLVRF